MILEFKWEMNLMGRTETYPLVALQSEKLAGLFSSS
jgi:hypothetical protein